MRKVVRLHLKILSQPKAFTVAQAIAAARDAFDPAGLDVHLVSTETLNLPLLQDLDIGLCANVNLSAELHALYNNRSGVGQGELVIYFVRQTVNPPSNGCAAHPENRPGAVVSSGATRWTLAHEIGHVLGLPHASGDGCLMTGAGTGNITNETPTLSRREIDKLLASHLTHIVV